MKALVAYFSASGVTAKVARRLAEGVGAELFEIRPETPYTNADLNWQDKSSRSSVEMSDKSFRPALAADCRYGDMDGVDVLFVGFPIWWYVAPTIINTFLEQYDLSGKKLVLFATSGMSGMGNTARELAPSCKGAVIADGKRFPANVGATELKSWAEKFL